MWYFLAALVGLCLSLGWAWDPQRLMQAGQKRGTAGVQAASALKELLVYLPGLEEKLKLATVNVFFNRRIAFRSDMETWGQIDYWASPMETMVRGQGDCEDFAIAKYFALLAGEVAPQRLRLVYVRVDQGPTVPQAAHMVLAYYPPDAGGGTGPDPWILDNLIAEIRPASQRPDLTPVFSFSVEGLWQGTTSTPNGDPLARLWRWRDMLAKAAEEGLP
jgi:predicted transglutaminase-like cysteine proteinase